MNKTAHASKSKCAVIPLKKSVDATIKDLLSQAMKKGVFDAVLLPMRVPAGDSFVYVLIKDSNLIKDACCVPQVMSVQGANAISSITRLGKGTLKIAAVMHPCEIRATNELAKLGQIQFENVTLISMDCPGVMPLSDFIKNPDKSMRSFEECYKQWDDSIMRPVCQICDKSTMIAGDLHIGTLGAKKDTFYMIPNTDKGTSILDKLGLSVTESLDKWTAQSKKITEEKKKKRMQHHTKLQKSVNGLDNLIDTFSSCINCHNCMNVCPICYCRLCYFDSDEVKHPSGDYLQMAESKGSIRFLPDTLLFHMGRMTHMALSCVSCGCCEDACPMDIPVAQIFSMIADETQEIFDYVSGKSIDEPLPLKTYEEDELHDVEDAP